MKRVALVAWLTVLWLGLWRDVSVANLASGVLVAVVATALFAPRPADDGSHRFRPLAAAAFSAYFAWKLVEANVVLARATLARRDTTRTGIIAVDLEEASDLLTTIVANSVSLTPGTLTLQTARDPRRLYVHVLHLNDPERVRRDIRRLEVLARRALGYEDEPASPAPTAGVEG